MIHCDLVARLLEQLSREIQSERLMRGLDAVQWAILRYLLRAGRKSRTVAGVANYLGRTEDDVMEAIFALVGEGYIYRDASTGELIVLNPAHALHDPVRLIAASLQTMSEADATMFAHFLEHTLDRLKGSMETSP